MLKILTITELYSSLRKRERAMQLTALKIKIQSLAYEATCIRCDENKALWKSRLNLMYMKPAGELDAKASKWESKTDYLPEDHTAPIHKIDKLIGVNKSKHQKWADRARLALRKMQKNKLAAEKAAEVFGESKNEFWSLRHHRLGLRPEARASHLAYAFLRGQKYLDVELKCYEHPDWDTVTRLVRKFGRSEYPPKMPADQEKLEIEETRNAIVVWAGRPSLMTIGGKPVGYPGTPVPESAGLVDKIWQKFGVIKDSVKSAFTGTDS